MILTGVLRSSFSSFLVLTLPTILIRSLTGVSRTFFHVPWLIATRMCFLRTCLTRRGERTMVDTTMALPALVDSSRASRIEAESTLFSGSRYRVHSESRAVRRLVSCLSCEFLQRNMSWLLESSLYAFLSKVAETSPAIFSTASPTLFLKASHLSSSMMLSLVAVRLTVFLSRMLMVESESPWYWSLTGIRST